MSFEKRSRFVGIRVTQDEYQVLDRISRRQGANSVSEFLRGLILNSELVASATGRVARPVTKELDELKQKVQRLSQMVERGGATQIDRRQAKRATS